MTMLLSIIRSGQMTLSYLVSTAGHAQYQNDTYPHDVESILQLIVDGAEEFGDEKVVGFTNETSGSWRCDRYSYEELLSLSYSLERSLIDVGLTKAKGGIVSLLCPTGLDFLVAWIALMGMGYGVVFIAPQCSPSAISHLIDSSNSTHLIYHPKYADLASSALPLSPNTPHIHLPPLDLSSTSFSSSWLRPPRPTPDSVSHIFHTSGTSGTPKPIPNTHYRSVSSLPRRALPSYISEYASGSGMAPSESAAFTTTPLFHGGVSDLLRGWMARSMVYFYPTSDTAITSSNVVSAIEACSGSVGKLGNLTEDQEEERNERFRVSAFLSVPYILTILAEEEEGPGMEMLQKMDMVSTGGAPLDTAVGDKMVEKGVRLVSRLGSSECGFLLSSHRDYQTEKDWEWLRNDSPYSDALIFEPTEGDKYEMVVTDRWRSKTKSNRHDGSYATGDLYTPHPTKKGVWRYVGRGDDVIVMSNGEKASPGPIETILRSSPLISDALIVGADQSQLGVLLFPKDLPADQNLISRLSDLLQKADAASPSYAQLSPDMCIVIQSQDKQLPKSSKGTIQRGVAYDLFKDEINALFGVGQQGEIEKRAVEEIETVLEGIIRGVVGDKLKVGGLGKETDLFTWGVDSLMATRIRAGILKQLNVGEGKLATNVVFEKPSIQRLAKHIHNLQEHVVSADNAQEEALQLMRHLADKYGMFPVVSPASRQTKPNKDQGQVVLVTGVTGSLGSSLLSTLLALPRTEIKKVICLVRAANDDQARERTHRALAERDLEVDIKLDRVEVYAADLALPDVGLKKEVWEELVQEVDVIVHAAWPVHFTSSLISFEDNIKGTHNLLNLISLTPSAKLFFCSSLASVLATSNPSIPETPTEDPSTAVGIGYSQSKWVTERVCLAAEKHLSEHLGGAGRVKILRVGQLCGDTRTGRWNEREGWPLMIKTADVVGCLPLIQETPSWLPVDIAAQAIADLISTALPPDQHVYHITHPTPLNWEKDVLDNLTLAGLEFDRVEPEVWVRKMEASEEDLEKNPSRGMLDMWNAAYGPGSSARPEPIISTDQARKASRVLEGIIPIDAGMMRKMVVAWRKTGFIL